MHRMRVLMGLTIAAMSAGCGVLPAPPGTRDPDHPPAYVNVVRSNEIHIRLVPQQTAGAPRNQHPAAFQPDQILALLSTLRLRSENGQSVALASSPRMQSLAEGLSKGFARAGYRQDVAFVVFRQGTGGSILTNSKYVSSGRMFYRDDTLNIIFGAFDSEVGPFKNLTIDDFDYGRRSASASVDTGRLEQTGTWHYHGQDRNWIEMPATKQAIAAARTAAPEVIGSSSDQTASSFDYGPAAAGPQSHNAGAAAAASASGAAAATSAGAASADSGSAAAPMSEPQNGPSAAPSAPPQPPVEPVAPAAASSASQNGDDWSRIEERLSQLKRLRERDLITPQDYQAKKEELLQQLP